MSNEKEAIDTKFMKRSFIFSKRVTRETDYEFLPRGERSFELRSNLDHTASYRFIVCPDSIRISISIVYKDGKGEIKTGWNERNYWTVYNLKQLSLFFSWFIFGSQALKAKSSNRNIQL